MHIPSSDLNVLMKEIWKVVIKSVEKQFKQPGNGTCQGVILSANIEGKLSKRIQRLQKIIKENLHNVEALTEIDEEGFLVFRMDRLQKIDCLHKILGTVLTDGMKDGPRKTGSHLKIGKGHE